MTSITAAVGQGCVNRGGDVKTVQRLLNQSLPLMIPSPRLSEDGHFGAITASSIRTFQSRVGQSMFPDGQIAPDSPTWHLLQQTATAIGTKKRQPPAHVTAFIAMALPAAKAVMTKWKIPASVMIAQSAQETGWGRSVKGNAYFGIKGKSPSGASVDFGTHEVTGGQSVAITDSFRAYKDFDEAADDYGAFLNGNPRYAAAFKPGIDANAFIDAMAAAGYATDPDYAKKLKAIIRVYDLGQYD